MGTLHTVRYRQPQTQSTPGLSHNGLLLNVGSPGVSLPDGPVHGLLLGRPRWRLLRLRLGRRIRLWLSIRLRWYVGNAWPTSGAASVEATTATAWAEDSVMVIHTATDSESEWALPQLSGSACPCWAVSAKWPTKSSSHPSTELARASSCSGLTAAHDI